jgi:hypothetical protein
MAPPTSESIGDRGRVRPNRVARPRTVFSRESARSQSRPADRIDPNGLNRLSRSELRAVWNRELGQHPPASLGRDILALGIAYARQEHRQGGLTKPVARELDRLLEQALRGDRNDRPAEALTPSLPRSGTVLVREWQGATHHVTIANDCFLWNGRTYHSLSAIARAITGTNWNGPRFFGMREVQGKPPEPRRGA